jgi:NAD(P)-dependent dehydrogenase (short-subunit alcohol dehydrogenase family)
LSGDRAGLLCSQDFDAAIRVQFKLAGGGRLERMDTQTFLAHAREYDRTGDMRDGLLKLLDLELQTHPFSVLRAAAPILSRGGGSVVLVSSAAARIGLPNHEAVAAAKAGVLGLARSAAATYASRGVRVTVVSPGLVRTPLAARIVDHEPSLRASAAMHALGRIGEPEEVARMIAFLLAPEQGWITGQEFGVDGGLGTLRARS